MEGRASLARLDALGVTPAAVVDDAPSGHGVVATADGGLEALARCDVVIKSPGISRYRAEVETLEGNGAAVVGGLGLWLEEVGPDRVIGITGTKGKSTTASIAGHLAARLGRSCLVGGNVGTVPWAPEEPADIDLWIVEVSSYQATDLWSSPAVVGVTSLDADHLNWHGDADRYFRDKLGMCGRRGAVITVANATDERLRARTAQLGPGPRWVDPAEGDATWTEALGLRGEHNRSNALIAATCLSEFGVEGAEDPAGLAAAAEGYQALPYRLETVAVVGGVEYVDDTLSTNVLPTLAAAQVFAGRPLALLVGGFERDIDYRPLARYVAGRDAPTLVLTLPQNGDRIRGAVLDEGGEAEGCADLTSAVRRSAAWAPPGGVVLLSPAAASFGVYASYRARSAAFRQAVGELNPSSL